MTTEQGATLVLGAGVVGLSTALYLQRSGSRVTVLDPLPPAGGTSYGNAGLISKDTAIPIAMPGMLGKVPGWLLDSEGPLRVSPEYFFRALPWLLRWIDAGRMTNVNRISDAMRALHRDALTCWRELLGDDHFADLIRTQGQIRIWEGEGVGSKIEMELCARHGIEVRELDRKALLELYPDIAPSVTRGMLLPGNACTINPGRLVRTLGELLLAAGGRIVAQRAHKIVPRGHGDDFLVMTNQASRSAQRIVVATGAWSKELLEPLGIRVPLETERGYHAMLPSPNIRLPIPISVKNRGFGMSSMEEGMRVSGTVEIGGLKAPPNERRAQVLVDHAKRLFPTLTAGEPNYWMGHRPSTPDSLPILGPSAVPGLFLAFGHGHFGMTGGPPSGRLVAQLVNGVAPTIDPAPYSWRRFD